MNTESTELAHAMGLVLEIDKTFAAEADAGINWPKREIKVQIKEGRRVVYYEIIRMDEGCEAKAKKVREDLEHLIERAELPSIRLEVVK